MDSPVEYMRGQVRLIADSLDPSEFALVRTSRDLEAIVDRRFEWAVREHRWYSLVSENDQIYAVADVQGKRISLQRLVYGLANPQIPFPETNYVSFANKIGLDCRLSNLEKRVGRRAVMRNRRPKRNTSSRFKGVIKLVGGNGEVRWKTGIVRRNWLEVGRVVV